MKSGTVQEFLYVLAKQVCTAMYSIHKEES